jgi:GT2 family glycosyltransferase
MAFMSIIIVSWNAKRYLEECLDSIVNHPLPRDTEVIVVDNASSDGSPDVVRDAFPGVRLICNDGNYGFAKANNIGIAASTGEYVFFINSDVVVKAGCFENMIAYMDAHQDVGVLGPKILRPNGEVQQSCMEFPTLWNSLCRALALDAIFPGVKLFGGDMMTYWQHDDTRPVDVITGCFWMVRRKALLAAGLLDERFFFYGEDVDWCRRFHDKGWKVVFYPEAEAVHYGGASSANAPLKFFIEMQRADYQYWKKHHTTPASTAFLFIRLLHHAVRFAGGIASYPFRRKKRPEALYKIRRSLASIKWSLNFLIIPQR